LGALRGDQGLPAAVAQVRGAAELDPRLQGVASRLEALNEEVTDVGAELRVYAEAIDSDPGRLEVIEGRLALLDQLKRKFGGTLEAVVAERERLESRLGSTADLAEALAEARRAVDGARARRAAEADSLPTLVFDEVDAGIGGEAALQVGLRLKRLGARHQVLVVTHLSQIACFADRHLLVEKGPGSEGRNVVSVRELRTDEERA